VDTSQPIVVTSNPPKGGTEKFKGQVLSSNSESMVVRGGANLMLVRTYNFSPSVHAKMLQIIAHGGYRYGDKVEIESETGSNVALNIKGKPSKPHS